MEFTTLTKEEHHTFIRTYHFKTFDYDPSDVEIKDHLKLRNLFSSVHWLRPSNIFQDDEVPQTGTSLMELVDASKYSWVDSKIQGTLSILNSHAIVREANIEVVRSSNWWVLPVESGKKICSNFEE